MQNSPKILEKINIKFLHIAIIIIGIIFISLSIFHTNVWFDESYTVAIVKHSFSEIWQIGGADVHPIFYYFCLHVLNLIFGNNLIVYRIFSALTIALLGVIGYTHIRKDFGEKTGCLFSFLALFLPVSISYAGELRMYALGMLLGTLTSIYAYRIYKGNISKTTYIFFGISSLLVSYTHYYGLMLAGIINLVLFIYLCKNIKTRKQDFIKFIITAVIQVVAYLPWLVAFIRQVTGVAHGFWISLSFPGTLYAILTVQYKGNFENAPIILTTAFYAYIIFLIFTNQKEERKPATWSLAIYISIIVVPLFISLCMSSVILLDRYLIIATGLLIFTLAFFMSKDKKIYRVLAICAVIIGMSVITNTRAIKESYAPENKQWSEYLQSQIQEGDIIVYTGVINGAVVTTELANKGIENQSYFYDEENWNVDEPYKAFAPYMQITNTIEEILDNYSGRIWIIEGSNEHKLRDNIAKKYAITQLEEKNFVRPYKNYSYTIELIEK